MISCGVGKVQSAVGHTGERKEETRERGYTGVHGGDVGGGGEIEAVRYKPAQDWVILRYHVLRITVPIRVCVRVYLTVWYVAHSRSQRDSRNIPLSDIFFFSLFLPFFPSPVLRLPPLSSSFRPLPQVVLPPPTAAEGWLVFFLPRELESLSRIPQRQIVCNAYLNTDTGYTLRNVSHTVAGLKDAGEVWSNDLSLFY